MAKTFDKKDNKKDLSSEEESGKKKMSGASGNGDIKLNLIKDEIVSFFDWKKNVITLLVAICLTTALLSAAYWGISWWGEREQQKQVEEVVDTAKIIELNQQISKAQERVNEIEVFEKRMKTTNEMVNSHIYWSNFFDFLQRNTLSGINYNGFEGGVDGSYTLDAHAEDYAAIDAQVKKLLDNKYVTDAHVLSASSNSTEEGNEISFSLNLKVDPGIFINYEKQ